MMTNQNAALFWSGGKDSAYALWFLEKENQLEIKYLVTTVNKNFKRVSMHGLREEIVERQAKETGYPLLKMYVNGASNEDYEASLSLVFDKLKKEGINKIIYGDIFLEDLREYRDTILKKNSMTGIYPLWQRNTKALIKEMREEGFRTLICCVSTPLLDKSFTGEELTPDLISSMPETIDPCGENGEFHTFCFSGPVFKKNIPYILGEKVYKSLEIKQDDQSAIKPGFWFIEVL